MSAQIIQFPSDRVRQVRPVVRSGRNYGSPVQDQVPTSIKVTRAVIFWSLVVGLVSMMFFSAFGSNGSAQATVSGSTQSDVTKFTWVTVYSGDTLWSLAEEYAPDRDPRDFIADLVALNNLEDSVISAGMQLALPQN